MCIMKHAWVNRCFDDVIHYKLLHVGVESAEWLESSLSCSSAMMHQHCSCFVGFTLWFYTDTAKYISLEIQCVHTYLESLQNHMQYLFLYTGKWEDNTWFARMCVDAALVAAFMQYQIFCTISTHIANAEVHMIDWMFCTQIMTSHCKSLIWTMQWWYGMQGQGRQ